MPDDESSLRAALTAATRLLTQAGVPSPRHDAEALAAHLLHVERRDLWRHDQVPAGFAELVERRAAREPLQHLTGIAYFRHLSLRVGPGVFVPRPETELLAGWAIEATASAEDTRVLDLCAGSGAIAISVAEECPSVKVDAVELSTEALPWLVRNVEASRAAARITVHEGDATDLDVLPSQSAGQFDVLVTNPPYIPTDSVIRDPEVTAHDPALALYSGADGLDTIRGIVKAAEHWLTPGGVIGIEHADLQGEAVPSVLRDAGGWTDIIDHHDLAGRPRYTTARWDPPAKGRRP